MKILLINPQFPNSLWSFSGLSDLVGSSIGQPPLGLATVAALTPAGHEITIIDENVEPIDFEAAADLVALGPFNVQFARAKEIAGRFRARGIPVAVGGPFVSLDPEAAEGHFDHTLTGEAEHIWPRFVNDLNAGQADEIYVQQGARSRGRDDRWPLSGSSAPFASRGRHGTRGTFSTGEMP